MRDSEFVILDLRYGMPGAGRSEVEIPYHRLKGDDRECGIQYVVPNPKIDTLL